MDRLTDEELVEIERNGCPEGCLIRDGVDGVRLLVAEVRELREKVEAMETHLMDEEWLGPR